MKHDRCDPLDLGCSAAGADMNAGRKVRRDAARVAFRSGQWRLALTVLVMPRGYAISKSEPRKGGAA